MNISSLGKRFFCSILAVVFLSIFGVNQLMQGLLLFTTGQDATERLVLHTRSFVAAQTTNANDLNSSNDASGQTLDLLAADFVRTLEYITKGVYLLMWPSLAISGAALSNELVYGKAFFLDRSLWKFWQMIRTFSNFALGFIFIGTILVAFVRKQDDTSRVKKLFKNIAIAGLLVNMSWWMVAAMIDLSTIGVVAFGGLPLSVMSNTTGNEDDVWSKVTFLKTHTLMDLSSSNNESQDAVLHSIVYSCGPDKGATAPDVYYAPCVLNQGRLVNVGSVGEPGSRLQTLDSITKTWSNFSKDETIKVSDKLSQAYCVYNGELLSYSAGAEISDCKVYETHLSAGNTQKINDGCSTFSALVTKATESTGPLYTLYGSMFAMAEVGLTSNFGNTTEVSMELLMKSIIGLGLLIPLLILAAVLVIRAVVLWLVIAFSPLLVMAYSFDFMREKLKSIQGGSFDLGNIIGLIFLPVFAVFALSISLVFIGLLSNITLFEVENGAHPQATEQASECKNSAATIFEGVELTSQDKNSKCYNFLDIQTICFDEGDQVLGSNIVNVLSWFVINMFGIAMMWMVIMFVLKANKFTSQVATTMEGFAKDGLMAAPILPIGNGGGMSIGGVKDFVTRTPRELMNKQAQKYAGFMNEKSNHKDQAGSDDAKKIVKTINDDPTQFFNPNTGARANTNLGDYNDITAKVIETINKAQPNNKIPSTVKTTQDLIQHENFWHYVDNNHNEGDLFTEKILNNRVKTSYGTTQQERSKNLKAGLMEGVEDSNYVGVVDENGRPMKDYIGKGNKIKVLQRDGGGTKINKDAIKVYSIPTSGLTSRADLAEFIRLATDNSGISGLPQQIRTKYLESAIGANLSITDQLANVNSGEQGTITVGTGTDINVTVQKTNNAITGLEINS